MKENMQFISYLCWFTDKIKVGHLLSRIYRQEWNWVSFFTYVQTKYGFLSFFNYVYDCRSSDL